MIGPTKRAAWLKRESWRRHSRDQQNGECGISRRDDRGYSTSTCYVKLRPTVTRRVRVCGWPLLALSGRERAALQRPLFGVKRKSKFKGVATMFPERRRRARARNSSRQHRRRFCSLYSLRTSIRVPTEIFKCRSIPGRRPHSSHARKHGVFRGFHGITRAGIECLFEKEFSMRVAVMATGALGGYFGGRLAEAGHDVSFIARGANLAAIRKNGLKVESPLGNIHIKSPKATDDPKEVGEVDLVLFAVKLWDVEKSGEAAKPLLVPNTRLISMLNGIDSVERLMPILGSNAVAAAPTVISAVLSAPGIILHKNPFAAFRCGFMDGRDDARLKALVDEMKAAKVNAEFSKTIEKELWEKFVFIVGMSGATASTRMPIGPIRDDADAFALMQSLMHEVEAVGVAKGIPLKGAAESRIALVKGLPPTIKASMLEDLERGNRLETVWFQGKVAELGRVLGVTTPVNRDVYAVLKLHRMGKGAV